MLRKACTRDTFKRIVTKAKITRKRKADKRQNVGYSLMYGAQKRNHSKCESFVMRQLVALAIKNKSLMKSLLETKQARLQMEQMIVEMQDMQMSLMMRLNAMHLELDKSRKDLTDAKDEKSKLLNLLKSVKNMLTDPILADKKAQQLETPKILRTPKLNSADTKAKFLPVAESTVKRTKMNLEGDVFHNFQHSSSKLRRVRAEKRKTRRISSAWSEVSFDPDTATFNLDELSGEDNDLSKPDYEGISINESKGIKRRSDSDTKHFVEKRHCQSLGNTTPTNANKQKRNCRLNTKSLPTKTSESTSIQSNQKSDCSKENNKKKKRGLLRPTNKMKENLPLQRTQLNDVGGGIRSRRNKGAVCYKEPSLTKKLRRESR